jgi:PmbA protein
MSVNVEMDQARCGEIFDFIRRMAGGKHVEVTVQGGRSALTRFANNSITQNVSEESCEVSVRVQLGGRTARATTNRFDDESLRRVLRQAEALAQVQEEDPELLPMLAANEQGSSAPIHRFCEETAAMGPSGRADRVDAMVEVARREGLNSAGTFSCGENFEALFNSRGVERWHRETMAQASVTMQAADSSGWQKQNYYSAQLLNARTLAEVAAEKALRSAHPVELEPGDYTVVLEPSAVVDLIGFLAMDFSGLALLEQRSCLNERLGTKLFGDNITIADDVRHPGQVGPAFDGEGVARRRLKLVEKGVVREVALARGTAARIANGALAQKLGKVRATGHGLSLPNEVGEMPANVVFEVPPGETKTVPEMIASTERGLLVTRLWYIREVDPYEKILTGMTRDGTFLVEDGRVSSGIRNFRFNQSVLEMLRQVLDLGEPVRACGEEAFDMVAPAMRVAGFHFTEVTRF